MIKENMMLRAQTHTHEHSLSFYDFSRNIKTIRGLGVGGGGIETQKEKNVAANKHILH